MSHEHGEETDKPQPTADDSPEHVPPKAWATLIMFAAFVVLFGSCASLYLFN